MSSLKLHRYFILIFASLLLTSACLDEHKAPNSRAKVSQLTLEKQDTTTTNLFQDQCLQLAEVYAEALINTASLQTTSNAQSLNLAKDAAVSLLQLQCSQALEAASLAPTEAFVKQDTTADKSNTQNSAASSALDIVPEPKAETELTKAPSAATCESVLGSALQKALSSSVGSSSFGTTVAKTLCTFANGIGVGFGMTLDGSLTGGIGGGMQMNAELMYLRSAEGAGEIALHCAPGVQLGSASLPGASVTLGSVSVIKTLGCSDTFAYEGPFLTFPLSINGFSASVSFGLLADIFVQFIDDFVKSTHLRAETSQQMLEELDVFYEVYGEALKKSHGPIEVAVLAAFSTIWGQILVLTLAAGDLSYLEAEKKVFQGLGKIFSALLDKEVWMNLLQSPLQYDSLKLVLSNLLVKLDQRAVEEEKKPADQRKLTLSFMRRVLGKLVVSLAGCDSISFTKNAGISFSTASALSMSTKVSMTYYTIPPYQCSDLNSPEVKIACKDAGQKSCETLRLKDDACQKNIDYICGMWESDSCKKNEKLVLPLASFTDVVNPQAWAKTLGTLATNTSSSLGSVADKVKGFFSLHQEGEKLCVNNVFELVPCQSLSLADIGSDVAKYTGFNHIGPLNFIAKTVDLFNPESSKNIYESCVKSTHAYFQRVGSSMGQLFRKSEVSTQTDKVDAAQDLEDEESSVSE